MCRLREANRQSGLDTVTLAALLLAKLALALHSREAVYYLGQSDGLIWGWLAWEWHRDRVPSSTMWGAVLVGAVGFLLGPLVAVADQAAQVLVVSTSAGIGAAGLVVLGARGELVAWRPLEVVGRYSFGVYLLHVPAWLLTGDAALAVLLTGVASVVSFHGFERPVARGLQSRNAFLSAAVQSDDHEKDTEAATVDTAEDHAPASVPRAASRTSSHQAGSVCVSSMLELP